jgi:hypothetical protein
MPNRLSYAGTDLAEYALPLAMVGLLALGSAPMLMTGMRDHLVRSATVEGAVVETGDSRLMVRALGQLPPGTILPHEAWMGEMDPAILLQELRTSIETAGSNGTTRKLLAAFLASLQRLQEEKGLDPAVVDEIAELANRGHRLAELQRAIEEAAALAGGDMARYAAARVQFEGRQYNIVQATALTMHNGETNRATDLYEETRVLSPATRELFGIGPDSTVMGRPFLEFVQYYETLEQKGLLADPDIHRLVSGLAQDVKTLSQNLAGASASVYLTKETNPNEVKAFQAANLNHVHSVGICHTGGGQDSGQFCRG